MDVVILVYKIDGRIFILNIPYTIALGKPATVAQNVAHPLVVEKVVGPNPGPTLRNN